MANEQAIDTDYNKVCPDCNALLYVDGIAQVKKDENNIVHCKACNGTTVNYLLDLD